MPKISIIIPVYNVEKYLESCLDSVLKQTFTNFEVICVNDGSPDNSLAILENYQKRDERIKIVNQENQGTSVARNNGLAQSLGKYIYFLDADDLIHPQLLELTYSLAEKYLADMVGFDFINGFDKELYKKNYDFNLLKTKITSDPVFLGTREDNKPLFFGEKKYRIGFSVWSKLYRKSILNGIEFIPGNHYEDYPHTFAVLAKRPKTVVILEKLYFRTIIEDSRSHQKGTVKQIKDYHIGINYIYHLYKYKNLHKELSFLKKNFIPTILRHQLRRCRMADKNVQQHMYQVFAEELKDLDSKGLVHWRGHKITRYFIYRKLIKNSYL